MGEGAVRLLSPEEYLAWERRQENYVRLDNGLWALRDAGAGERITLASCGVDLSVDDLYLKVFPRPPAVSPS